MREPRRKSPTYLAWVRTLPCLVCKDSTATEAAHIRYGDPQAFKRPTGMGEKPDDRWAIPLCSRHHREQHSGSERKFWQDNDIDPVKTALALWVKWWDGEA